MILSINHPSFNSIKPKTQMQNKTEYELKFIVHSECMNSIDRKVELTLSSFTGNNNSSVTAMAVLHWIS